MRHPGTQAPGHPGNREPGHPGTQATVRSAEIGDTPHLTTTIGLWGNGAIGRWGYGAMGLWNYRVMGL
eukprot:7018048-Pyramimonas_sp.AAC.1